MSLSSPSRIHIAHIHLEQHFLVLLVCLCLDLLLQLDDWLELWVILALGVCLLSLRSQGGSIQSVVSIADSRPPEPHALTAEVSGSLFSVSAMAESVMLREIGVGWFEKDGVGRRHIENDSLLTATREQTR